ncbi:sugar transporter domain-containing protein [Ditylenchus destructor]|uniref:Sugar transporter domain-containing protein n=1 Tax=Ditylenchus destructor TaxID=166010 RepID=A0AAD4R404_9BILA|nr:sugar transporter domain-containing protein [Ditylenchus destructor]
MENPDSLKEEHLTSFLLFSVFAATIGSSFQFGYHLSCVNPPGQLITKWYNESHFQMFGTYFTPEEADFAWSITVSMFAFGGMFGGLLSGWLADRVGRRGTILYNNVLIIIAVALMTSAKYIGIYYLITAGRFLIGISAGINCGVAPVYLTEISPIKLRGTMGSANQLVITFAVLISMIVGLPYIFGDERRWPFIFAFALIPCLIQLTTLPFCPESPKYSLLLKHNRNQAERDLKILRGRNDVSAELNLIEEENGNEEKIGFKHMFFGEYRWPLVVVTVTMLAQQFSGINAILFYSTRIFRDAGLSGDGPIYASICIIAVQFAHTGVSTWLVDHPKCGRRPLLLLGFAGMFVSSIFLAIFLSIAGSKDESGNLTNQWAAYVSILFVLSFVVSFATGPGAIPWFLASELFSSAARGVASAVVVVASWCGSFTVGLSFLELNHVIGQLTFLLFACILLFSVIFTYKFVPETKGKSVDEINADLIVRRKHIF